jgi:hypothetical protein
MHTDIVDGISRFCQQHSASFVPSPAIVGQLDASLNQAMQSIERRRNIAVNVGTGVLTAVICPAAGVAGNAGEALGGAVVRQGARSGVAAAAKRAAAAGAVLAVKKVPKKPTLLGKLVRGAAQIVKDINPLEALGDAWAENRKYDSFEAIARRYSIDIASRVLDEFSGPYEREVLLPLRNRSAEIEHGLENRRAQRQEKAEEFREECRAMQAVAEQLSLFAESPD